MLPDLRRDWKDRLYCVGLLVLHILDQTVECAVLSINDLSRRDRRKLDLFDSLLKRKILLQISKQIVPCEQMLMASAFEQQLFLCEGLTIHMAMQQLSDFLRCKTKGILQ